MKLFMVIYMLGMVGGTVGPLPNEDMEWCSARAAEYMATAMSVNPNLTKRREFRLACEWRDKRPEIDPQLDILLKDKK